MRTSDYRTSTFFKEADNQLSNNPKYWPMAIDAGYSGMKVYGPNLCAVFPSYAKEIDRSSYIGELSTDDILYTDITTGKTWLVGRAAQNMMQSGDTNDSIEVLCGRNRYFTPMFLVLVRTAMGLAMMQTKHSKYVFTSSMTPVLQTGLPCQYIKGDTSLIKEALTGEHHFKLQIGQTTPCEYNFTLTMDNIRVMQQPMGAFISASTNVLWKQDISKFANQNVLIVDPGFYTLDTFSVRGGAMDSQESWTDFGMKRILQETSDEIYKQYGQEIPVSNMQKWLETGTFTRLNRRERRSDTISFGNILETKSRMVCEEALDKLYDMYNSFIDYRYLILTGGTGAAWAQWVTESLKNMSTLSVISGYTPDGNPQYFANVRGYYAYLKMYLDHLS